MQAGSTQQLSYTITLANAFTLSSAEVNITRPDGTVDTVSATIAPGGSATTQILTALYMPPTGDKYELQWVGIPPSGPNLVYYDEIWVTWKNPYPRTRTLLAVDASIVPDTTIDGEYQDILLWLYQYAPTLPPYYQFNSTYQSTFDKAMEKLVASRLKTYTGAQQPLGELTLFKQGTTTLQYTARNKQSEYTVDEVLWEQGWQLMLSIPEIAVAWESDNNQNVIPTRGDFSDSNYHTNFGDGRTGGTDEFGNVRHNFGVLGGELL